jgi:hypothetical protein
MGAWHQAGLADWLSVVMWLWLRLDGVHSETVKFTNWCYTSATTNAIYQEWMELVGENVYLFDVQIVTFLVFAFEDFNFLVVSFFIVSKERRAAKFCVELKRTAAEKCVRWWLFICNKRVRMTDKVQGRARVVTSRTKRCPSNFQKRRINGNRWKVFGRRSNIECSDVRRKYRVSRVTVRSILVDGARDSVVVKVLCYKPEGRGFDTRWGDFLNLPNPSCRTRPWGLLSL